MDAQDFDVLAQRLSALATRRRLLGILATSALVGTARQESTPTADAAGKQKRRKRHKRRCGTAARRRLCAEACGPQELCGKPVDCGECPCSSDGECQATGRGDLCCDGTCVSGACCSNDTCANPTPACVNYTCAACTSNPQCPRSQDCHVPLGVCCDPEGTPCTSYTTCCSRQCDFLVGGGTCSSCKGHYCDQDNPCCGGESCTNSRCGGCLDRAIVCTASFQCCFSDCHGGACLSNSGGRCVHDADCRACYSGGQCTNTCVNGVCVR